MIRKVLAFTLAETLIVMGIIGIVSALTLPNLNSSTGEKEKVAKVKKIYQNLDDAYGRARAVYGPLEEWFITTTNDDDKAEIFMERVTEFMKISKKTNNYIYILADGTEIYCRGDVSNGGEIVIQIEIDIDGPNKGKNQLGIDIFNFNVRTSGVLPGDNLSGDDRLRYCFGGRYCTDWVIMNDNMDYLKADSNGKCPNAKQLSWTNISCK